MLIASRLVSHRFVVALLAIALWGCTSSNAVVQSPQNITEVEAESSVNNAVSATKAQEEPYSLLVHRASKRLEVRNNQGVTVHETKIGIGSGGLKEKRDMNDYVTPTGEMSVDLILYKNPEYNQIAPENVERFTKVAQYRPLVSPQAGLAQLFQNMNRIDFDGNGSPDNAYGDGYIGLTSNTTITGPKMSSFKGTPYWFSIALHGTPNPKNIGQANSGGCVHLSPETLQQLIEQGWVKLGTKVTIVD